MLVKASHKLAIAAGAAVLLLLVLRRRRTPNAGITASILSVDNECRCTEISTFPDGTQTKRRVSVELCLKSDDQDVENATLECLARSPQIPSFTPSTFPPKVEGGLDA